MLLTIDDEKEIVLPDSDIVFVVLDVKVVGVTSELDRAAVVVCVTGILVLHAWSGQIA